MNQQEFNAWTICYFAAFPSTEAWLRKQGDEAKQQAILGMWFRTLADFSLADCDRVTFDMNRETLAPPEFPGDTARIVARFARRIRSDSESVKHVEHAYEPPSDFRMAAILGTVRKAIGERGLTIQQAVDEAMADLPASDPEKQPRYRCLLCRDSGLVEVWHWRAAVAAKHGHIGGPGTLYTALVACTCNEGSRKAAQRVGSSDVPYFATYDEKKFLRCRKSDLGVLSSHRQERIDELVAFMVRYGVTESDYDAFEWKNSYEVAP